MIDGFPAILSDQVTLTSGQTKNTNARTMSSPYRAPYMIEEARFMITPPLNASGTKISNLGGCVRAKLSLGRWQMTNGFMPIWNLCPRLQRDEEVSLSILADGTKKQADFNFFRWVLPRPMYVPAGMAVTALVSRNTDADAVIGASNAVSVDVILAGRFLPPSYKVPATTCVPYATAYIADTSSPPLISSELDLQNPFQQQMYVQRFIGRVQYTTGSTQIYDYTANDLVAQGTLQVSMQDSHGYNVIRDPTLFASAFNANTTDWIFGRTLDSREYYKLKVTTGGGITLGTTWRPMVSMVGYREEVL